MNRSNIPNSGDLEIAPPKSANPSPSRGLLDLQLGVPDSGEVLKDEIFSYLNCHEISASEVNDGMTYIDSSEAKRITTDLCAAVYRKRAADKAAVLAIIDEIHDQYQSDGSCNAEEPTKRAVKAYYEGKTV
jgi:hypothetical protein